jgi:hypothetical protein
MTTRIFDMAATALNSRGIRNKNPGNCMSTQPWEGMTGADDAGFAVFGDAVWGFRAMFRNYISYFDAGINTIDALVRRWSPAAGNKTAADPTGEGQVNAYISALCTATGWAPTDPLQLKIWDVASRLCYAQTIHECGQFAPTFTLDQMKQGALRAGINDAPLPIVRKVAATIAGSGATGAAVIGAAQVTVTSAQGQPHSPTITAGLFILAAVLAGVGAYFSSRAKLAGSQ